MHPIRVAVGALGAVALAALVAGALPCLPAGARAASDAASGPASAPALDPSALDRSCRACDDFYRFATGGCQRSHRIRAGHARWGAFDEASHQNVALMRNVVLAAESAVRARRETIASLRYCVVNVPAIACPVLMHGGCES